MRLPLALPATRFGRVLLLGSLVVSVAVGVAAWRRARMDPSLVAVVRRGSLTAQLTTTGTLRPIESLTYRSPIAGRDVEIVELVPEGTRVKQGDLIVRLDTTDLERDVERTRQDFRQAQLDFEVAEGEFEEAEAAVTSVSEGEGALTVAEQRTRLQLAERKTERLRQEYEQLQPLMVRGFITRDELARTATEFEQAEEELALARKRTQVVEQMTHPRETKRAALQLAQKDAQRGRAKARIQEVDGRLTLLRQLIDACSLYARGPGLVVYEEYLNVIPRRKIHVGDRVTSSQGIVTIPEVSRMLVDASVGEAEVHRVTQGQAARVRVEAFADLRLTGKVVRVGTLASSSAFRPLEDKRFDLVIELDPTTAELRPEMTVRADILVGTRADVLLLPVNAVFERQGMFVAHVSGPAGVDTRPIELGEANDQVVEVIAGLREGDRVLMTDPQTTAAPPDAGSSENRDRNALQPR